MTIKEARLEIHTHVGYICVGTATEGGMVWFRSNKSSVLEALHSYDPADECPLLIETNDGVMYVDGILSRDSY
jgi:hypothetical protein